MSTSLTEIPKHETQFHLCVNQEYPIIQNFLPEMYNATLLGALRARKLCAYVPVFQLLRRTGLRPLLIWILACDRSQFKMITTCSPSTIRPNPDHVSTSIRACRCQEL